MVAHLQQRGYTSGEIYGTTWGDGGVSPAGLVDMKCSYVKQVRSLIIAVRQYTGTKVDVIAYSMVIRQEFEISTLLANFREVQLQERQSWAAIVWIPERSWVKATVTFHHLTTSFKVPH